MKAFALFKRMIVVKMIVVMLMGIFTCNFYKGTRKDILNIKGQGLYVSPFSNEVKKSKQIIFVQSNSKAEATIQLFQLKDGEWKIIGTEFNASLGKEGITSPEKKVEGDNFTPSGIYTLGFAFGYAKTVATKLPYLNLTKNHFWIDDPSSKNYNKLVETKPKRGSYEVMRRNDHLYKLGIVINYNTNPVLPGKGSAIFFHLLRKKGIPTAGCIAIDEINMITLLNWLDPENIPIVIIK
jgi:L,D-peptidoglycan transpeptidase YkuD (ErfK/YbiS/YcfS/YnhG family)